MGELGGERRLAAILAADVVDYSSQDRGRRVGHAEAVHDLRAEVLDPLIARHHGRVFKTMGEILERAARLSPLDPEMPMILGG